MRWFKTAKGKRRPVRRVVSDRWHRDSVNGVLPDVPLFRVVVAFLVVWVWTAGMFIFVNKISWGPSRAVYAVGALVYLVLFGIPAGAAMYNMERRSFLAYILAALGASVPVVLYGLVRGSPAGAGIMVAIAVVGGLIAYVIVERLSGGP